MNPRDSSAVLILDANDWSLLARLDTVVQPRIPLITTRFDGRLVDKRTILIKQIIS